MGRDRSTWSAALQPFAERTWRSVVPASDLEDPCILRLDLVGHLLDLDGVLAHGLDRAERRSAGLGLDLDVGRILAAQVDEELLALARHDPGEQQPRRAGIGRR